MLAERDREQLGLLYFKRPDGTPAGWSRCAPGESGALTLALSQRERGFSLFESSPRLGERAIVGEWLIEFQDLRRRQTVGSPVGDLKSCRPALLDSFLLANPVGHSNSLRWNRCVGVGERRSLWTLNGHPSLALPLWIPAFAGMTEGPIWIPACAGMTGLCKGRLSVWLAGRSRRLLRIRALTPQRSPYRIL